MDYTGSDPQLGSLLNMPTGGRERHPLVMAGLTHVLYTLDNSLWLNAGTLRSPRAAARRASGWKRHGNSSGTASAWS
ncbi:MULTISPECIES: hypothetical protein [Paracoccus]|uniref:hypothetical protein n=1 Tax=Paracoccus TaxID=265 RepID=UPI001FCC6FEA|nr:MULTISPECIES: hypothetical protein [Paracoccus]